LAVPGILIILTAVAMLLGTRLGTPGVVMGWIFIVVGVLSPFLFITGAVFGIKGWASGKTYSLLAVLGTFLNGLFLLLGLVILYFYISLLTYLSR
jgi:hypothetical protein